MRRIFDQTAAAVLPTSQPAQAQKSPWHEPWAFEKQTMSGNQLVETGFEGTFAFGADGLFHDLAVLDEQEGRDGTDTELGGEILLLIHVYFADLDLAGVFASEFVKHGANGLAGSAPFGPKVHEHGRGGLQRFRFKILGGQINNQRGCHTVSFGKYRVGS